MGFIFVKKHYANLLTAIQNPSCSHKKKKNMNNWTNIKKARPDKKGRYLVVVGRAQIEIAECRKYMKKFEFFLEYNSSGLPVDVTHWMELPTKPYN